MNIVCVVVLWATFCFQLIIAHPPQRDDSEDLIILRQVVEGGKSDKDMVDKHLYMYLDNFEKIYQEFNSSFPDLFCANESALRNLHINMEKKLDQVKEALDLKKEQLLDLGNILTHDNYTTTGLNTDLATECESLKDYIKEANNTAFTEKIGLDQHLNDVKDLKEKMNSHACPCEWKEWSEWSYCPVTCGGGIRTRAREIFKNATNDGQECSGERTEEKNCNDHCCPVDCTWGSWNEWTACPRKCPENPDEGYQFRDREMHQHECGGIKCDEKQYRENKTCSIVSIFEDEIDHIKINVKSLEKKVCSLMNCQNGCHCNNGDCQCATTTTTTTTQATTTTTQANTVSWPADFNFERGTWLKNKKIKSPWNYLESYESLPAWELWGTLDETPSKMLLRTGENGFGQVEDQKLMNGCVEGCHIIDGCKIVEYYRNIENWEFICLHYAPKPSWVPNVVTYTGSAKKFNSIYFF